MTPSPEPPNTDYNDQQSALATAVTVIGHAAFSDDDPSEHFLQMLALQRQASTTFNSTHYVALMHLAYTAVQALGVPRGARVPDPLRAQPAAAIAQLRATLPTAAYDMLLTAQRTSSSSDFSKHYSTVEHTMRMGGLDGLRLTAFTAAVAAFKLVFACHVPSGALADKWDLFAQLTHHVRSLYTSPGADASGDASGTV